MKKAIGKSILVFLVWTVLVVWVVLFFTGGGVLVVASERKSGLGTILVCKYLTGRKIIQHEHLKTNLGVLGHEACPWIIEVK